MKVSFVVLFLSCINGSKDLEVKRREDKLESFLKDLMKSINSHDSATSDVILLKIVISEKWKKKADDMFESVVRGLATGEYVISTLNAKKVSGRSSKKGAVIVIVSDVWKFVRIFQKLLYFPRLFDLFNYQAKSTESHSQRMAFKTLG